MPAYSAALSESEHAREPGTVPVDPRKTYELSELIDPRAADQPGDARRLGTRPPGGHARGLAEGSYYPALAAAGDRAVAHVPLPIPQTVTVGSRRRHVRRAVRDPRAQSW